jgi:diguanylate cyclase (GGDEF)-like protein
MHQTAYTARQPLVIQALGTTRENHMNTSESHSGEETTRKLVDIQSKERVTSDSIGALCDQPALLKQYLESSIGNTFSELLFRLTHEIYTEDKATELWHQIVAHRASLSKQLDRDVGMLVAALDYLFNVSGDIASPKIIDDVRLEEAADMATHDSLTGLYLRGVFEFSLERLVQEHRRYDKALSVLLLDIDDFKQVNDQYGHQTGDEVLRRIGKTVLNGIRKADFPARYGGEEIAIILPETSIGQATVKADRLREDVRLCFAKSNPTITVSIGVSCIAQPDATTASELVRQADKALYEAKRSGKDKVVRSA